jgi:acyl carrier protein
MDTSEILSKIADVLGVSPKDITLDTKATDLVQWDSMGTIGILLMLDSEFGIKLSPNEAKNLQSVEGVLELLRLGGIL